MLRTWMALGLLVVTSVARAGELTLQTRFDHAWNTSGWSVYTHVKQGRESLIAFNRNTLEVEMLSPIDGATLASTRLDVTPESVRHVATLSTSGGEFLIAFVNESARGEQTIEVHTLGNANSFSITPDARVNGLDLVERQGDIFIVAQTAKGLERYERFKDKVRTAMLEEFEDDVVPQGNRVQGSPKATWSLAPARGSRSALLTIREPRARPVSLFAGDAARVREVSTFLLNDKRFFAYVANETQLTLQSGDAVYPVANKRREVITSVRLVPSVRSFAIVLEGKKGSRLLVLSAK